jgi:FkbM family methyltransferase
LGDERPRVSYFGWALARSLRVLGKVWVKCIGQVLLPSTPSAQLWKDRFLHLNEAVGQIFPILTLVISCKTFEGTRFFFRPFTDDADKVSAHYEKVVRELISPRPSEVVVDAGANIGTHTVWLSKQVGPSGMVLAIEPEPNNYAILEINRRINNLSNIISLRVALSSRAGNGKLDIPRPTLMGQAKIRLPSDPSDSLAVPVEFQTLDNVLAFQRICVSAIKIDVEGAEVSVLQGAMKTITKFNPRLIVETHGKDNLLQLRTVLKVVGFVSVAEVRASSRPDEERHFVLAVPNQERQIGQEN